MMVNPAATVREPPQIIDTCVLVPSGSGLKSNFPFS
jgi:hypothetical protein